MDEGPNVKECRVPDFGLVSRVCHPRQISAEAEALTATWELLATDWPGIMGYYCLQKLGV